MVGLPELPVDLAPPADAELPPKKGPLNARSAAVRAIIDEDVAWIEALRRMLPDFRRGWKETLRVPRWNRDAIGNQAVAGVFAALVVMALVGGIGFIVVDRPHQESGPSLGSQELTSASTASPWPTASETPTAGLPAMEAGSTTLVVPGGANPQLSADGQVLVYNDAGDGHGTYTIWLMIIASGAQIPMTSGFLVNAVLAPDGTTVAAAYLGEGTVLGKNPPIGVYFGQLAPGVAGALDMLSPDGRSGRAGEIGVSRGSLTEQGWLVFSWGSDSDGGSIYLYRQFAPNGGYERLISLKNGSDRVSVSQSGEWVVFDTTDDLLGKSGNGGFRNVYRMDVATRAISLVSRGVEGSPANGNSYDAVVADDGTVAFVSDASNLVEQDTNAQTDVFCARADGTMSLLSHGINGRQSDGDSTSPEISADGRFVVFDSAATDLVPNDRNGERDVFRARLADGSIQLLSAAADGSSANGYSWGASVNGDGSVVAFSSRAQDIGTAASDHHPGVFVTRFP